MKKFYIIFPLLGAYLFFGCGSEERIEKITYPSENCNILSRYDNMPDEVKNECFFPFPFTQFYSGGVLDIPKELFRIPEGYPDIDLRRINSFDGFSPASQIMFWHPRGFSREGLPEPKNTLSPESPVQLIEHPSGQRIPVFVEPDARANPPFQVLYIRPLKRMKTNTRYIVVIKKGLKDAEGVELTSPIFFRAVLENKNIEFSGLKQDAENWRQHFSDILRFLESLGINRSDILVAWDFKTASEQKILVENMLGVRKRVYEFKDHITFVIDEVKDFPYSDREDLYPQYRDLIQKQVKGRFYPPKVDGNGVFEAEFLMNIPKCVFENPATSFKPMLFGHGLFGSYEELNSHNLIYSAQYFCTPIIATNWIGIDNKARGDVFNFATSKLKHTVQIVEYVVDNLKQGHANFLALAILVKKSDFWDEIRNRVGNFSVDMQNPVYYGISNGAIQGSIFMTLTKDVELGVLDVGGSIWTAMLERNKSWDFLRPLLYPEGDEWEFEIKKVIAVSQIIFDVADPITFAPYIVRGSDEFDIKPKKIIYREALYDEQVANFTTETFVRTAGIPAIKEFIIDVFGIEKVDATEGYNSSGFIQVDPKINGIPEYQYQNISLQFIKKPDPLSMVVKKGWPAVDEGDGVTPHTVPRLVPVILEIQKKFYGEGKIYQLCSDQRCDPD